MTIAVERSFADEVERLHVFFSDWFGSRGDHTLDEFTDALAPGFYLVSTDGSLMARGELIAYISSEQGSGDLTIAIENPTIHSDGDVVVGTYEEHQVKRGIPSSRMSTAVLARDEAGPGGWIWVAVHETWIDRPA